MSPLVPVFVGFACNNACVFCAQGAQREREPEPGSSSIELALRTALRESRAIAFVGGEPTLRPELPSWVEQARAAGAAWIVLQTNGRRLSEPGFAERLARAGAGAVDVSLHGSSAAMHEYHTGVPGSWAQTLRGIRRAVQAGLQVGVTTVVTRSNFRHLEELAALAHRLGAAALHLEQARAVGRALADWERVVPSPEMAAPHLAAALRRAQALGLGFLAGRAADPPEARRLFAGLGRVEPPSRPLPDLRAKAPEPPPLKARPAVREKHAAGKRTGEELRRLFPRIFEA